MTARLLKIILSTFVCIFLLSIQNYAQETSNDKHIEVALRMLGHEILLSTGDSTSRVLPISKENNQYRIQFESEFVFDSENLTVLVNRVVKETALASSYIFEVEDCATTDVVYSFEMNQLTKSDIIPCVGRVQPKSCYNVLFTIADKGLINKALADENSEVIAQSNIKKNSGIYIFIGIISLLLLLLLLRKRLKVQDNDPNLIPLGAYHFDKRNTELIINQQKIELTSKEADLLLLLYNGANTTVERDVILNMVWGDEGDYIGRTVDVFISKLRKKLEFDSKVKIVNVRGVGYKLVLDN